MKIYFINKCLLARIFKRKDLHFTMGLLKYIAISTAGLCLLAGGCHRNIATRQIERTTSKNSLKEEYDSINLNELSNDERDLLKLFENSPAEEKRKLFEHHWFSNPCFSFLDIDEPREREIIWLYRFRKKVSEIEKQGYCIDY